MGAAAQTRSAPPAGPPGGRCDRCAAAAPRSGETAAWRPARRAPEADPTRARGARRTLEARCRPGDQVRRIPEPPPPRTPAHSVPGAEVRRLRSMPADRRLAAPLSLDLLGAHGPLGYRRH